MLTFDATSGRAEIILVETGFKQVKHSNTVTQFLCISISQSESILNFDQLSFLLFTS